MAHAESGWCWWGRLRWPLRPGQVLRRCGPGDEPSPAPRGPWPDGIRPPCRFRGCSGSSRARWRPSLRPGRTRPGAAPAPRRRLGGPSTPNVGAERMGGERTTAPRRPETSAPLPSCTPRAGDATTGARTPTPSSKATWLPTAWRCGPIGSLGGSRISVRSSPTVTVPLSASLIRFSTTIRRTTIRRGGLCSTTHTWPTTCGARAPEPG